MATLSTPDLGEEPEQDPSTLQVDETLVDQIWLECQGKVTHAQVHLLVVEATSEFAEATITTYIPILIRRQVRKKLVLIFDNTYSDQSGTIAFPAMGNDVDSQEGYFPATGHLGQGLMTWLFQTLP